LKLRALPALILSGKGGSFTLRDSDDLLRWSIRFFEVLRAGSTSRSDYVRAVSLRSYDVHGDPVVDYQFLYLEKSIVHIIKLPLRGT